jgi:hypothetical protein
VSYLVCVLLCAGTGQTAYEKHVAERAAMGVVPKPISAAQCSDLVKLLENPPKGEEDFLLNLLTHRVPPGVDEAAYVKADFLTAIVKGKTKSPLIDAKNAVKLLGTMQGGYNVQTLIEALDTDSLAPTAAEVCFLNAFFLCQPCLACVERVGTSVWEHCQPRVSTVSRRASRVLRVSCIPPSPRSPRSPRSHRISATVMVHRVWTQCSISISCHAARMRGARHQGGAPRWRCCGGTLCLTRDNLRCLLVLLCVTPCCLLVLSRV